MTQPRRRDQWSGAHPGLFVAQFIRFNSERQDVQQKAPPGIRAGLFDVAVLPLQSEASGNSTMRARDVMPEAVPEFHRAGFAMQVHRTSGGVAGFDQ